MNILFLRNDSQSILSVFNEGDDASLHYVEKKKAYGIQPQKCRTDICISMLSNNPDVSLVTLSGKAGTGKTLMALAASLERRRDYKQIFLARPVIPLSNRDIGFLPGDIFDKLDPYMQPLFDNLSVIQNQFAEDSQDYHHESMT
jgi:PhoH-like ATPase